MQEPNEDRARREELEERFGLGDGPEPSGEEGDVFFADLLFGRPPVAGWELAEARPARRSGPVRDRSWFWRPPDRGEGLARVHAFESDSRDDAYRRFLRLLSEFQRPDLRPSLQGPGHVSLTLEGSTAVLFQRGNLAIRVLNAGPEVVELGAFAAGLDEHLARPPEGAEEVPGPKIGRLALEAGRVVFEARDPLDGPLGWRFYGPGRFRRDDGTLRYEPAGTEREVVRAYALNGAGGVSSGRIEVAGSPGGEGLDAGPA